MLGLINMVMRISRDDWKYPEEYYMRFSVSRVNCAKINVGGLFRPRPLASLNTPAKARLKCFPRNTKSSELICFPFVLYYFGFYEAYQFLG